MYTQYIRSSMKIYNICICCVEPLTIRKIESVFYAQSKKRPNVEGISNALGLPTRDQLHKVFLRISLKICAICRRLNILSKSFGLSATKSYIMLSQFTYEGFTILAEVVFFLLFRHFLTYASIRCAIFLGLISPVLLWHICNVIGIVRPSVSFAHI